MAAGAYSNGFSTAFPEDEQLISMRLNGKVASDLYSEFYGSWKLDVFYNVGESKLVYDIRMKELFEEFSITDPLESNSVTGKFDDPNMQVFYDALLLKGKESEKNAVIACALMEEKIYRDLGECSRILNDPNAKKILKQMRLTTGNHLRALVKELNRSGVIYDPQLISNRDLDNIMGSGKEIVSKEQD